MIVRAIPAPAIALTMTMPHAWANINTAAALPRRRDPICTTCDIQATLRGTARCRRGSLRAVAEKTFYDHALRQARSWRAASSAKISAEACAHRRSDLARAKRLGAVEVVAT
jgi:hypothetical protein